MSMLFDTIDNICDQVNCGKGNCSVDLGKPFQFVCQCEPGWKRTRSTDDNEEDDHQFLPCVIPNCTITIHSPKLMTVLN